MGRPADMLPLQYDQPYIWCPNIYSRPFELYALYKCRAGHQVFSKVMLSQGWHDSISTTWHRQNTLLAEYACQQNCQQNTTVSRIHSQQNTLSAEYDCWQNCWQNTQSTEHTIIWKARHLCFGILLAKQL